MACSIASASPAASATPAGYSDSLHGTEVDSTEEHHLPANSAGQNHDFSAPGDPGLSSEELLNRAVDILSRTGGKTEDYLLAMKDLGHAMEMGHVQAMVRLGQELLV